MTLSGAINNGGVTLTVDGASDTTLSGVISGTGGLTKAGSGSLTVSGSGVNTYSGNTAVNQGIVYLNKSVANGSITDTVTIGDGVGGEKADIVRLLASNQIDSGSGTGLTLKSSGWFDLNGYSDTIKITSLEGGWITTGVGTLTLASQVSYSASGTSTAYITGNLALGANRDFTVNDGSAADDLVISANISGAFTLTKKNAAATGRLVLSGNNSYTGLTTLEGGSVRIEHSNALGTTAAGTVINSGAALETSGGISVGAEGLTLSGTGISSGGALRNISGNNSWAGNLTLAAASTIASDAGTLTIGGNVANGGFLATFSGAGNSAISGVLSGTGGLTKSGAGTLTLSGANTFSGATTISAGAVNAQNSAAFGTTAGGVSVTSGAAVQLQGGTAIGAEALTLNGSGVSSDGALRNISGNNSWAGAVTLGSASTIASDSGTLTVGSTIANGGFTSTFGGAGDVTASGVISGTGGLTKSGAGTLTLSAAETFTGALNVSAGTLLLGAANRIADTVNVTMSGGKLSSGGFNETVGTLTLTADSVIDFGSGASVIHFASSAAASWTGGTILTITNWSGPYAGGGTDQLFFGTGITGLTGSQLGQIQFVDNAGHRQLANILSTGEVVPIPEPATVLSVILVAAGLVYRERKNLRRWVGSQVGRRRLGTPDSASAIHGLVENPWPRRAKVRYETITHLR